MSTSNHQEKQAYQRITRSKAAKRTRKPTNAAEGSQQQAPVIIPLSVEFPDIKIKRIPSNVSGWNETDSIHLMLKEIGSYPLLEPEQERVLSWQVRHLVILEEIGVGLESKLGQSVDLQKWATAAEIDIEMLNIKIRQGQYARNMMQNCNLRLVVSIAKKMYRRCKHLTLGDLTMEGAKGLSRAVDCFEPEKGHRFSTYATWWIRQAISRSIQDYDREIRLPCHIYELRSKISKAVREAELSGQKLNASEIAVAIGVNAGKVKFALSVPTTQTSLDKPVGKDKDGSFGELLVCNDDKDNTPEKEVDRRLQREAIEVLLDKLPPQQRRVMELLYGIETGSSMTLQAAGKIMGISRERVRQIQAKALERLRRLTLGQAAEDY